MAMLGGGCSKCCGGLKCYVPADTHGACCKLDGTCSIEAECDCDTENGAVFAGVGEGCEFCDSCQYRHLGVTQSLLNLYDGLIAPDSLFEIYGPSFSTTERPPDSRLFQGSPGAFWFNCDDTGLGLPRQRTGLASLFSDREQPAYVIDHPDGCANEPSPLDTRSLFLVNFCHSATEAFVRVHAFTFIGAAEKIQYNGEDINALQLQDREILDDFVYQQDDNPFSVPGTLSFHYINPERVVRFVIKDPLVPNPLP